MQDYPKVFNAAFVSRHGEGKHLQPPERLRLRTELAKSMVNGGYSHLLKDLDRKAKEQHEKALAEWELILNGVSEASDVSAYVPIFSSPRIANLFSPSSARDTLFDAVHPLLQAIGSYANCYISLIVGDTRKNESDQDFFTA